MDELPGRNALFGVVEIAVDVGGLDGHEFDGGIIKHPF